MLDRRNEKIDIFIPWDEYIEEPLLDEEGEYMGAEFICIHCGKIVGSFWYPHGWDGSNLSAYLGGHLENCPNYKAEQLAAELGY